MRFARFTRQKNGAAGGQTRHRHLRPDRRRAAHGQEPGRSGDAACAAAYGGDLWEAAGFLDMTVDTLSERHGHYHPAHLSGATGAFARHRRKAVETVAGKAKISAKAPSANK